MSDLSRIARPYAKAVFDLARAAKDYPTWTAQLALLAAIGGNAELSNVLQNPAVSKQQQVELLVAVAQANGNNANNGGGKLTAEGENLVKLLAQNGRLNVLTQINQQFIELRDEAQQVIEAQLITATKIDAEQKSTFELALSKRLGKKIKLAASVDEDIIGGAVVRAGDWVVDGSVKAQLQNLIAAISA